MNDKYGMGSEFIKTKEVSNGFVHGFTLANFLQYVEVDEKSWTLRIVSGETTGFLHFREGLLIDARTGEKRGEEAALDILSWDHVNIAVEGECSAEKTTIKLSLKFLILEASRLKDENDSLSDPTALLERGIRSAEAHHFKQAMADLKVFLTDHRDSAEGWLWYSRCSRNLESIEKALNNAVRSAPEDPEILQEIEKLSIARKSGRPEKLRRCPVCWAPIDIKSIRCGFCDAHLFIPRQAVFPAVDNPKKALYEAAIQRYSRIVENEQNINGLFYLCLVRFNLQQSDAAIETLQQAVSAAPEKVFLRDQLSLLKQHASSAGPAIPEADLPEPIEPADLMPGVETTPQKHVLVVEDSRTTRALVVRFLEKNGFGVIEAEDGFQALSRLNDERPDLVLLDIILPGMDGYKILSIIRNSADFKELPVIMLTSRDGLLNKMKGRLAGSTAYLTKPFDPEALLKTIGEYL